MTTRKPREYTFTAAVLSRVPETIRGAVEQAAGVSAPEGDE